MDSYKSAMELLWRHLHEEQKVRFLGQRMRVITTSSVVMALRMLSPGQLSDVLAKLRDVRREESDD